MGGGRGSQQESDISFSGLPQDRGRKKYQGRQNRPPQHVDVVKDNKEDALLLLPAAVRGRRRMLRKKKAENVGRFLRFPSKKRSHT